MKREDSLGNLTSMSFQNSGKGIQQASYMKFYLKAIIRENFVSLRIFLNFAIKMKNIAIQ
jgi:hypothetical protein